MSWSDSLLAAQDPDELFDIVDADGIPTGVTKRRAVVHRDGDWHRAVHVWICGIRDGSPFLLFQRRSRNKDTAPGRLDPTVSGHFGAGESIDDVWREVEEEIGVPANPSEMRFAGVRVRSSEREQGIIDREIQDVYLWRRDDPLATFRPNPAELDGLVAIAVADIIAVYSRELDQFTAMTLDADTNATSETRLSATEISPSVDRYPFRVAVAVLTALRGDQHIAV